MGATIRVGHSPDPDDAFLFWALLSGRIDTGDRRYEERLYDIETLNRIALEGTYEVTAISVHAYAYVADRYELLPYGGSVGDRYGPVLVGRLLAAAEVAASGDPAAWLPGRVVAVPGLLTTAYLVLKLMSPAFRERVEPFDSIPDVVAGGEADAGLLIHEGQLTYEDRGLFRLADLGEWWHSRTGLPLPLGANAVRRDLDRGLIAGICGDMKASIEYAMAHREEALRHAVQFGRGLDIARADRFVGMYVNDFALDYGESGRNAIKTLLDEGWKAGIIPRKVDVRWAQ
ncbi:MAG: ABC transporter substrate-binding protein [Planctomycetota bacterium]|nr:ABC transporter substrate-binding protein [Planctomycetota bacterium]